jgi:glucan 1,4-alpha-glucosidase
MQRYSHQIGILSILMLICQFISAQKSLISFSPNHQISLSISIDAKGQCTYSSFYLGKPIITASSLGIELAKPATQLHNFQLVKVDSSLIDETWSPVWGEQSHIRNHYREIKLGLKDKGKSGIRINLYFRIFDDGIGFRYEFPKQYGLNHFIVANENTYFGLTGNHDAFWIPGDYDSNEYTYTKSKLTEIDALAIAKKEKDIAVTALIGNNAVQTPLMLKSANGIYLNIHEAALINYPAMNLVLDKSKLQFRSQLVPDAVGNKAYLQTPFQTPWRTIIVSNKASNILASKMILNLNEPSKIKDQSWIKPQKFVGMWWEMHTGKSTWQKDGGKHGANTERVKNYIDFAAANEFDGVLVEGWNVGWEDWFGNWKENVFDFVTPYADYDINTLTKYAQLKNVRIIMHHETSGAATNYERHMDTAYRFMVNHGMNTVKTGYVGKIIPRGEHHDGQWMVNHYLRAAEKTASYKIMIDAHEPVHPTGLHRTYPNWMANEGARGMEFNNAPTLGMSPDHTTILPFTRLMGGPMDFTPGFFHLQLNQFVPDRKTRIRTTLCKQLALYITLYSPLQMVSDLPENYLKYPDAFQFIKDVAVDWDDTKIIDAEPGDYICIARKAKATHQWFLGAITDENSRMMHINLDFLDANSIYTATIYQDGPNADWDKNPEAYQIEERIVKQSDLITVKLARSGGVAISFKKKKTE